MRPVAFVVVDTGDEHDSGIGERVELLAIEALAAGAGVERLDEAVLLGRAGFDVEGLDAAQGEAVAHEPRDELVGTDVLGGAMLFHELCERANHFLGVDAAAT